jgi:hypothetical protein
VDRGATPVVDADSESCYAGNMKRRQVSTVDASETSLIITEQHPRGNISRKVSRVDPAQLQIVHQPTTDFPFHSACGYTVTAPGTRGSTPCAKDARRYSTTDTLVCAPGKSASILDTLGAVRRVSVDAADSITSRTSLQIVRYEGASPVSILSRYAQNLSKTHPIYNNANGVDLRRADSIVPVPTVPQFPRRLGREQDRQNHTMPLQDHDRGADISRSLRGHRRAGQVQLEDESYNLTDDLRDMLTNAGMSTNEFCSATSSPIRMGSEMVRALEERSLGVSEYRPGDDHSRSLSVHVATGRTWREAIGRGIANDLSFSSQRLAIENAAQENGAPARSDGAGRQMVARTGDRLRFFNIGDDRNLYHDAAPHNDDAIMVPRHILQRDPPVQMPLLNDGYEIYDPAPPRFYRPTRAPASIRPISEIHDAGTKGIESTMVTATAHSQQQEISALTQVRNKVAAVEQRGGSPTAQSSGNWIGAASWFPVAAVPIGQGSGVGAGAANNDATVGYSTPPTGMTSQKKKTGSTKSGHSGTSQSLDERRSERELARLSLELAAKIRIMTMDSQVSPSRGGSRGTSDASSVASSCQSRQLKHHRSKQRYAESEKSTPLNV